MKNKSALVSLMIFAIAAAVMWCAVVLLMFPVFGEFTFGVAHAAFPNTEGWGVLGWMLVWSHVTAVILKVIWHGTMFLIFKLPGIIIGMFEAPPIEKPPIPKKKMAYYTPGNHPDLKY